MAETERVWVEQKKGEFVVRETLFQGDGEFARFYAIGRDGAFTLLREKLGDPVILVDKRKYLEEAVVGSAGSLEDVDAKLFRFTEECAFNRTNERRIKYDKI